MAVCRLGAGTLSSACASAGLLPSFTSAQKHVLNCAAGPAQSVTRRVQLLKCIAEEAGVKQLRPSYKDCTYAEHAHESVQPLRTHSSVCVHRSLQNTMTH
jgi:hypothetical protein